MYSIGTGGAQKYSLFIPHKYPSGSYLSAAMEEEGNRNPQGLCLRGSFGFCCVTRCRYGSSRFGMKSLRAVRE